MQEIDKFFSTPYQDRQLIIVSDEEFLAQNSNEKENKNSEEYKNSEKYYEEIFSKKINPSDVASIAISTLTATRFMGPLGGLISAGVIAAGGICAMKSSNTKKNGVPIYAVSREMAKQIKLPIGHPCDNVVYVGHPTIADVYYVFSDFHRCIFEHKFNELILFLMGLGAKKINVQHISGWSRDFAAGLSVPITGKANLGGSTQNNGEILFEATLPGRNEPALPENLVWFDHEPSWITLYKARANHGISTFDLSVNYSDDFRINADVEAKIANSGLSVGGKFESIRATKWRIFGEF